MFFENVETSLKKLAILITAAGAFPFLIGFIFIFTAYDFSIIIYLLIVYSGLIVSFISGANWIIFLIAPTMIRNKKFFHLVFSIVAILPIILVWLIIFFSSYSLSPLSNGYYQKNQLLIMGIIMILILFFDGVLYKLKLIASWWFILRISGSLISGSTLILINVII